jgi:hypothetical protein
MDREYSFRAGLRLAVWLLGGIFCACLPVQAQKMVPVQEPAQTRAEAHAPAQIPSQLDESGQIAVAGRAVAYRIRRLPVSSFPDLPAALAEELNRRGCLIPQTYEAHAPENVVHASLERAGSSDWAVLCSSQGTVTLLVSFASGPAKLLELATAPESERLQAHDRSGVLGFNWGIDPALPERIREAQAGLEPRPPSLDHDALADSIVDRRTVYHFYSKNTWTLLAMPE